MPLPPKYRKMELVRHEVTQQDIARKVGLSHSLVNRVVNGKRRNPVVERAVAEAIGLPEDEIFPPRPAA